MSSVLKLHKKAKQTLEESVQIQTKLFESVLTLHSGDYGAAVQCMESVVSVLGNMQARMTAGKDPLEQYDDPRIKKIMMGIVAGAQVLMDQPDAAEAHNLTQSKLAQIVNLAGQDTEATKALLQVARSAPTVTSAVVKMFQEYNNALQSGDEAAATAHVNALRKLWMFWQRQTQALNNQTQR